MKKILFVCTGNTCRSCMAEGIFNSIILSSNNEEEQFTAVSAGIYAYESGRASKNAIEVLKNEFEIDISSHSSKRLTQKELDEADLVLTMTFNHKDEINSRYLGYNDKVFTLKEFTCENFEFEKSNKVFDIADPFSMSIEDYRICAFEIKDAVEKLVGKLKQKSYFDIL